VDGELEAINRANVVRVRDNDREFGGDIDTMAGLVREGMFERFVPGLLRDLGCE
jgi:hypothetical protein